jgi:F-type H+-transporting ATPase subunit delta
LAGSAQAKRFAQAVFQIARQNNDFDRWLSDLKTLAGLEHETAFVQALETPKIRTDDKMSLLKDRFPMVGPLAINLVGLLVERGRIRLLPDISRETQRLTDEYRGIQRAEVVTAVALNDEEKRHLEKRLSEMTGKNTTITTRVEPALVGGIIARFDGKLLDASTRSRLEALKKEISQAPR